MGGGAKVVYDSMGGAAGHYHGYFFWGICLIGIVAVHLWKLTTYSRRYRVWVLESMLIKMEGGCRLKRSAVGPQNLMAFLNDKQMIDLLDLDGRRGGDSVGKIVADCGEREIFKWLRVGILLFYLAGILVAWGMLCGWCVTCEYPLRCLWAYMVLVTTFIWGMFVLRDAVRDR